MKSTFPLLHLGFVLYSCFLEVARASLANTSICYAHAQHPFRCPAKGERVVIDFKPPGVDSVEASNEFHNEPDRYPTAVLLDLPNVLKNATAAYTKTPNAGEETIPFVGNYSHGIPEDSSVKDDPEVPQQVMDPVLPDASPAQFPSFEDWKLASDRAGDADAPTNPHQRKRTASWLTNFDEDGNLAELDPKTSEGEAQSKVWSTASPHETSKPSLAEKYLPSAPIRSGDALKHSKERFNYASFDCAAIILSTNSEAKGSTAILIENKDQYMLNQCSAEKFVIAELCDEILVDTVALANYEFFSSMFKDFQISVSNRWPAKENGWVVLGKFRARNSRDIQVFGIEEPQIFARYIRIDFLSHYGNEYYCPLSLLRVYGTTMMESYKKEIEDHQPHPPREAHNPLHKEEGAGFLMPNIPILSIPVFEPPVPYTGSIDRFGAPTEITPLQPHSADSNEEEVIEIIEESSTPTVSETRILTTEELTQAQFPELGELETKLNNPTLDVGGVPKITPIGSSTPVAPDDSIKTDDRPHMSPPATGQSNGAMPPPPINPGTITQESIFKTIMKRLAAVEHNATLSHRYLEEQSKAYNQVFAKIEAMQRAQLTSVISQLNRTALKNAENTNRRVKHLRDELENLQKKYKRELSALDANLERLADEVVFEKRLGLVQLLLLLCILCFIGVSRFFKPPERIYIPTPETYSLQQFIDPDVAKSTSTKSKARRRSAERNSQMKAMNMTSAVGFLPEKDSSLSSAHARAVSMDSSSVVSNMMLPAELTKSIPSSSAKKKKKRRGSQLIPPLSPSIGSVLSSIQSTEANLQRLGGQITAVSLSGSSSAIGPNGSHGIGNITSSSNRQVARTLDTNEKKVVSDDLESPLGHKRKTGSNANRQGHPLAESKSNDNSESSGGRSVKPPPRTGAYLGGGRKTGSLPNIYFRQPAPTTKHRARPSNNFFDALSTTN